MLFVQKQAYSSKPTAFVIPTKVGIQYKNAGVYDWVPAFAGTTENDSLTNRNTLFP